MEAHEKLSEFLAPYDTHTQEVALALREFITTTIPEANELIWDNYNALALAYSKSEKLKDAFCHISVYSRHVNFGFNRGAEMNLDPKKFSGKGKLIRHMKVNDLSLFPQDEVMKLVYEALSISEAMNEELVHRKGIGISIVKSISERKIRPGM